MGLGASERVGPGMIGPGMIGPSADLARFIVCKMPSIVVRFVYRAAGIEP